jgi:hypothetical protein
MLATQLVRGILDSNQVDVYRQVMIVLEDMEMGPYQPASLVLQSSGCWELVVELIPELRDHNELFLLSAIKSPDIARFVLYQRLTQQPITLNYINLTYIMYSAPQNLGYYLQFTTPEAFKEASDTLIRNLMSKADLDRLLTPEFKHLVTLVIHHCTDLQLQDLRNAYTMFNLSQPYPYWLLRILVTDPRVTPDFIGPVLARIFNREANRQYIPKVNRILGRDLTAK